MKQRLVEAPNATAETTERTVNVEDGLERGRSRLSRARGAGNVQPTEAGKARGKSRGTPGQLRETEERSTVIPGRKGERGRGIHHEMVTVSVGAKE